MDIPVVKSKVLDDGLHNGTIIGVEYRDKPYAYTDVVIELADSFRITVGYPTVMSEASGLGKMLIRFGQALLEGQMIDPNKILVGKKCQFQTTTKETEKGKFSNVVPESLKPIG